jgi:hypothetical protein
MPDGTRYRIAPRRKSQDSFIECEDLWDFIHYNCPMSRLEAQALVGRFVLGRGERELAAELGLSWRTINRATWRMKAKLRSCALDLHLMQRKCS